MTYKFCPQCSAPLSRFERDGVLRLGCDVASCGYIHYDNPTPVVAAIVEHDDAVILVRSHGWPNHWYGLVTGFLEHKEAPEVGILREVKEELGLSAELVDLVGVYPFEQMNQVIIAYHVRASGDIILGDELAGFKSVPIGRLKPWPQATGLAVRDWLTARSVG